MLSKWGEEREKEGEILRSDIRKNWKMVKLKKRGQRGNEELRSK